MEHNIYNYWLSNRKNIGPVKIEALLRVYGCSEEIFHLSKEALACCRERCLSEAGQRLLTEEDIASLLAERDMEKLKKEYHGLAEKGIRFITREDEEYPDQLRAIYAAPFSIYVKGSLPGKGSKCLSIVGARDCSQYGREMARYLAGAVAKEGVVVISGLARGIDTYAHQGALKAGGHTYAVLGCGIDTCYPRENIGLYMEMQQNGGILSEYPPGTKPYAGNFPMRNRIISGLSDAILIIEARQKSGSLITVDMGLEQGKDIYALPGRATDPLSEGCNNLLKLGAKPVTSPKDILEDMLPGYREMPVGTKSACRGEEEHTKKIFSCLTSDPKHIEELALLSGLHIDQLMEQLLILELRGQVRQTMKNYYCISIN
jgi:DNA processing protein